MTVKEKKKEKKYHKVVNRNKRNNEETFPRKDSNKLLKKKIK